MAWEARPDSKIAQLLNEMRAMQEQRPIWTQDQAAKAMGVARSLVPNYVAGACNAKALHRRTVHNGIELSLTDFPVPGAAAPAPAAGPSIEVPRFIPPQMVAPRPGSVHPRVLASSPRPAPLGPAAPMPAAPMPPLPGPEDAAADAQVVASASTASAPAEDADREAFVPLPDRPVDVIDLARAAVAGAVGTTEEGAEEEVEEEPELPDAWISCRTGAIVLTGVEAAEDGSITLMPDLVAKIKQRLAWTPLP